MYEWLINILVFCGILLLLVMVVSAVQITLILIDLRRTTHDVREKFKSLLSIFDLVTFFIGGLQKTKGRLREQLLPGSSTLVAFVAGLRKSLEVLFKNKGGKDNE